jgi:hypothetical protein
MPSSSMSMGGGALPMGAEHMHVAIMSPAAMTKVTGNSVMVQVRVTGYTDTCALAGKHVMGMEATTTGHYHVLLDGALVNMYCTPAAVVSLQNVRPGMHTLTVAPALDDHAEVTHNARSVMFDYAPASPLPALTGMMTMGKPSITIVSPKPGATVSGTFTVTVRIKNFRASCALFGKPNLDGYGHWHPTWTPLPRHDGHGRHDGDELHAHDPRLDRGAHARVDPHAGRAAGRQPACPADAADRRARDRADRHVRSAAAMTQRPIRAGPDPGPPGGGAWNGAAR